MNKILIYNHGGSQNHGCEALARTAINLLGETNDITLCTESPQQDIHYGLNEKVNLLPALQSYSKISLSFFYAYFQLKIKHNYFYIDILPYRKTVKQIESGVTAISIGGDIYCYSDYPKYIKYHQMLCKKGCKTILLGCSLEEKLFSDKQFIDDMKSYTYITARESLTYGLLKKAGIKNIGLYPDAAFTLPVEYQKLPKGFIEGNTIGINLSPLVERREKKSGIVLKNYECLISHLLKNTDCAIALIPHVVWEGNDDREILKVLYDKFSYTERIVMIEDCNCMQLKGFISRCRFFVGARTHATIAAYSSKVPTLVLGYSIKSRGIAKDLFGTDENYVISVEALRDQEDLTKAFSWIYTYEKEIKQKLNDVIPGYIKRIYELKNKLDYFNGEKIWN